MLVRTQVMLGRYPYVEPSRCPDAEQGQAQMAAIMDAGITTFVCLQMYCRPTSTSVCPCGRNSHGLWPSFMGNSASKHSQSHAVCMQDELPPQESFPESGHDRPSGKFLPYRSIAQATKPDTVFLYTPIVDLGTPSHELLEKLLVDLRERLAAGQVLYIHCWGGRGRCVGTSSACMLLQQAGAFLSACNLASTVFRPAGPRGHPACTGVLWEGQPAILLRRAGTVGSTLLISGFGVEVEEALERVQRAYSTRNDESPKSPETPEQFDFIRAYATQYVTAK
eukprot:364265-Chlamydomonas_euryale.AAC.17